MTERNQPRDAERLSEEAARRVLHRASELEAARGGEMSVADLRDAAREAGITPGAFEQALAEYRGTNPGAPGVATPRRGLARFWPAALALAILLSLLFARLIFVAA